MPEGAIVLRLEGRRGEDRVGTNPRISLDPLKHKLAVAPPSTAIRVVALIPCARVVRMTYAVPNQIHGHAR